MSPISTIRIISILMLFNDFNKGTILHICFCLSSMALVIFISIRIVLPL